MSCKVCGTEKTVRSHILPKAFAHEIRADETHVVGGSRHHTGAKPSQGGIFSNDLLCATHEGLTAAADKYAVEFVRRIAGAWDKKQLTTLKIDNPRPLFLRSFAVLTIWREVHCSHVPGLSLGPYDEAVRGHIFEGADPPEWAVVAQRTNFVLRDKGPIDFNLHPFRVRFADRTGWMLVVAGIAFFVITDQRGLRSAFSEFRVDLHDPAIVTVSDPLPFTDVKLLRGILTNMAAKTSARKR